MSLGEALAKISGDEFEGEKNDEKKVRKPVASAGDANPGQDPPAGFLKAGFGTPSLPRGPVGGRIVCASRHPPRPLGGLENWRLGGLEDGIMERIRRLERNWGMWVMSDE